MSKLWRSSRINQVERLCEKNPSFPLFQAVDNRSYFLSTERFENQAQQFQKSATQVKKMMRCKNLQVTCTHLPRTYHMFVHPICGLHLTGLCLNALFSVDAIAGFGCANNHRCYRRTELTIGRWRQLSLSIFTGFS